MADRVANCSNSGLVVDDHAAVVGVTPSRYPQGPIGLAVQEAGALTVLSSLSISFHSTRAMTSRSISSAVRSRLRYAS